MNTYRVTVRQGRYLFAEGTPLIGDPHSGAQVVGAAQAVCEAKGKKLPSGVTITVHSLGNRPKLVAEVTA